MTPLEKTLSDMHDSGRQAHAIVIVRAKALRTCVRCGTNDPYLYALVEYTLDGQMRALTDEIPLCFACVHLITPDQVKP